MKGKGHVIRVIHHPNNDLRDTEALDKLYTADQQLESCWSFLSDMWMIHPNLVPHTSPA